ncbi:MAG: PASTA domain-containing protein, partial [Flavisolibacter sp.]|nr:PASTA domain-containing protein [Flavisolibacter sp.]
PHAPLHYGGQLAAPVFKEIASKLYAMYVQKKKNTNRAIAPDSVQHIYSGYANDIQNVLQELRVTYKDSVKQNKWSTVYATGYEKPVLKPAIVNTKSMPDVRNMTLRDALYVLENMDVKVNVKGRGKVLMQDVSPGTPIGRNQSITLLLN